MQTEHVQFLTSVADNSCIQMQMQFKKKNPNFLDFNVHKKCE